MPERTLIPSCCGRQPGGGRRRAQARRPTPPKRGFGWRNERPSIIFGEDVYVSLRARAVFDWRGFDPDLEEDTFDLNVGAHRRSRAS